MNNTFYMPAEWGPHTATWITWPKDPITWPNRIEAAQEIYLQMIELLSPHERVNLLVEDESTQYTVQTQIKKRNTNLENVKIHLISTVDSWIRDYGPIFVKTSPSPLLRKEGEKKEFPSPYKGEGQGEVCILDFFFNAWGNKYECLKKDDDIPQRISHLLNIPFIEPGIILEGGSIDVNGKGSLLTTEQCLLNKNRNPKLSKTEIETYLKKYLGVTNILWLGEGIEGDDTDGHIDDITRFVSEDTIVTVIEEDPSDSNYEPLKENLEKLRRLKDQDGKEFKIVTLPMPGQLDRDDGEGRLPASYANFYIANQTVLVPIYKHKNDAIALESLQKLFPKRKVIGLDCRDLIYGMGAIHCLTQQQPA